jgi:FkbM family methyltransferase
MTYVKHDEFIGKSLGTYGEWAQNEIDHLLRYIGPGDFVIDIGANVGFHAFSFAKKVGPSGIVWAFEPDPVNGLLLRHNIIEAGLNDVVIPFDAAVSDAIGVCQFRTYPIDAKENFGHTAVDPTRGNCPRLSLPLDELAIERAPALIKLDIEGHELPALRGMSKLIQEFLPVVSIEADTPEEVEANGAAMASIGYDVYSLVVDAYNVRNFAGNGTDIWKGNGRCANLLCVMHKLHNRASISANLT